MNYQQTLDYLYNALPMFSRMGSAAFKKDLTNTRILCERLGNPQQHFRSLHIGGTNGKGSVSHMLASILQTAGYRTGLYTSPHLYDFRERIKVNGMMTDRDFVVDFVKMIRPVIDEIQPSFFEITVAMAFAWFQKQEVDVAVVEVGLGGRLDSTNIILPGLSVITNIGWDHMNMLGNSLEEIAGEKAGIIKQVTPIVIGERQDATDKVFMEIAGRHNAPIFFAQDFYESTTTEWKNDRLEIVIRNKKNSNSQRIVSDLPGIYQAKNVCTVLQAVDVMNEHTAFTVSPEQVVEGISKTKLLTGLAGRWEILKKDPSVVLEVAHNADGVRQMMQHISRLSFHHLHLVLGTVKDKDVESVLKLLPSNATYYFTQALIPRALAAEDLKILGENSGLTGGVYTDVNDALQQAITSAEPDDLVIVCGSIFLVAEVNRERFMT